jgi:hypothetical protein
LGAPERDELPDFDLGAALAARIISRFPEFAQHDASAPLVANCQANNNALLDGLTRNVSMRAVAPTVLIRGVRRPRVQTRVSVHRCRRRQRHVAASDAPIGQNLVVAGDRLTVAEGVCQLIQS